MSVCLLQGGLLVVVALYGPPDALEEVEAVLPGPLPNGAAVRTHQREPQGPGFEPGTGTLAIESFSVHFVLLTSAEQSCIMFQSLSVTYIVVSVAVYSYGGMCVMIMTWFWVCSKHALGRKVKVIIPVCACIGGGGRGRRWFLFGCPP
jgi:hypothetical protein